MNLSLLFRTVRRLNLRVLLAVIAFWSVGMNAFALPDERILRKAVDDLLEKRLADVRKLDVQSGDSNPDGTRQLASAYQRLACVYACRGNFEKAKSVLLKSIEYGCKLQEPNNDDWESFR